MATSLPGSKHGEGIGGPVSSVEDPNDPSFDPATHGTETDKKIRHLLQPGVIERLNDWERNFLMDCYGKVPLSRKAHIKVAYTFKKYQDN